MRRLSRAKPSPRHKAGARAFKHIQRARRRLKQHGRPYIAAKTAPASTEQPHQMAAESLLEPQQRAARVRLHQEHEVCAERNVHKIYRQRQHKRHAAGQVSGLWADIPARCKHDGTVKLCRCIKLAAGRLTQVGNKRAASAAGMQMAYKKLSSSLHGRSACSAIIKILMLHRCKRR